MARDAASGDRADDRARTASSGMSGFGPFGAGRVLLWIGVAGFSAYLIVSGILGIIAKG